MIRLMIEERYDYRLYMKSNGFEKYFYITNLNDVFSIWDENGKGKMFDSIIEAAKAFDDAINQMRREGERVRQSSEKFMDEMLKDNAAPKQEQSIEEIIDQKLEQAMSKLTDQLQKVTEPKSSEQNNNSIKEDLEDEQEGNGAGSKEGASQETDS